MSPLFLEACGSPNLGEWSGHTNILHVILISEWPRSSVEETIFDNASKEEKHALKYHHHRHRPTLKIKLSLEPCASQPNEPLGGRTTTVNVQSNNFVRTCTDELKPRRAEKKRSLPLHHHRVKSNSSATSTSTLAMGTNNEPPPHAEAHYCHLLPRPQPTYPYCATTC